jgi:hypothetical protein
MYGKRKHRNRASSVNIVTRQRAGRPAFHSQGARKEIFLFATASRPVLGNTQPPVWCVPVHIFPELKGTCLEDDHSASSSAEDKNAWRYTCTAPYVLMSWCLVKTQETPSWCVVFC